jgi:hypothetical protein
MTKQSEQWINPTSYPSQQVCMRHASRIIDDRRNDYIRRGLGVAYVFNEGIGGFSVEDKEACFYVLVFRL